ncbi:PhzF family isomerase [Microvirga roseola]|uniref:PhzF family isomerase n=1 Tax=Microvirga roseola TaxID=2883126 RepID=UPI001E33FD23|nr:PhzF family isomerase [Microvirga roseola]
MASYQVYQVDAFTQAPFEGNPAGVVLAADGLSEAQMQAIARELNNSETAFVLRPRGGDHDVLVRFFTPTVEVPVCGHATIAAHYVRAVEGLIPEGSTRQLTGAGVQRIDVERLEDGDFRIWIQQQPPTFGPILSETDRRALVAALGIRECDLGQGPIEVASTGHSKVMVPIRDRAKLDCIRPDLKALSALSRKIGCNGYYPFTLSDPDPGFLAHGRMFAPAIGIAEDPVTGNANGPLGAYLIRHDLAGSDARRSGLTALIRQGEVIGRPGQVRVEVAVDPMSGQPNAVRIGGNARIVFRTELAISS